MNVAINEEARKVLTPEEEAKLIGLCHDLNQLAARNSAGVTRGAVCLMAHQHDFGAYTGGHHVAIFRKNSLGRWLGGSIATITHDSPDFN
jgi:hypothetical protein